MLWLANIAELNLLYRIDESYGPTSTPACLSKTGLSAQACAFGGKLSCVRFDVLSSQIHYILILRFRVLSLTESSPLYRLL